MTEREPTGAGREKEPQPLSKWQRFIGVAMGGKIDPSLYKSLGKYAGDPDMKRIIQYAVQYGGMSEREIDDAIDERNWPTPEPEVDIVGTVGRTE